MRNVWPDESRMNRATPYPWPGPHDRALSTSTSSVPFRMSRSSAPAMPPLYPQRLRVSSGSAEALLVLRVRVVRVGRALRDAEPLPLRVGGHAREQHDLA